METGNTLEGIRKAMQDFLAPELRSLSARMDAVEKTLAELRHDVRDGFTELRGELRIHERVAAVELQMAKLQRPQ